MFYSIFINSQVEKTALIRGVLQNQNYSKLRAKVFCTTKIVVYYTKLTKIIREVYRRGHFISPCPNGQKSK